MHSWAAAGCTWLPGHALRHSCICAAWAAPVPAPQKVVLTHLNGYLTACHKQAVPCPDCPSGLPEWQFRQDISQEEGDFWDVPEASRSETCPSSIWGSAGQCVDIHHTSYTVNKRAPYLYRGEADVICNRNLWSFCFLSLLLQLTGFPLAVWVGIYKHDILFDMIFFCVAEEEHRKV